MTQSLLLTGPRINGLRKGERLGRRDKGGKATCEVQRENMRCSERLVKVQLQNVGSRDVQAGKLAKRRRGWKESRMATNESVLDKLGGAPALRASVDLF